MIAGVWSVIAIYLLLNLAFLRAVPITAMAGDNFVAGSAARAVFGPAGDAIVNVIVMVGMLSAINAILLMSSRVPHAMAEDGLFPRAAAEVSAVGTPRITLLASAVVAVLFIATGTFDQVLALLAFFFVANYTLSFISVFVLRRREPAAERPYRAWGYPWTTGLGLLGSTAFLVAGFFTDRANSLISLGILAGSFPLFLLFRRLRPAAPGMIVRLPQKTLSGRRATPRPGWPCGRTVPAT